MGVETVRSESVPVIATAMLIRGCCGCGQSSAMIDGSTHVERSKPSQLCGSEQADWPTGPDRRSGGRHVALRDAGVLVGRLRNKQARQFRGVKLACLLRPDRPTGLPSLPI